TTVGGGSFGFGTVFELSPLNDGTWQESILYDFCSVGNLCQDGKYPSAGVIFDAIGNLYGMTLYGGGSGSGTVFELSPPSQQGGSWTEQVLWSFPGANVDGVDPNGGLVIDAAGNLFGTTEGAVTEGAGLVFELSPGTNGWTESLPHIFCLNYPDCSDGAQPMAGVTIDKAGNLYGTTMFGGQPNKVGWGVAYELSPTKSGWTETVLKVFTSVTGGRTSAGITIDPAGNLYGGLSQGRPDSCGGYFRLLPFEEVQLSGGCSPGSDLVYSSGALFGSTGEGGTKSQGLVFKFTKNGNRVTQTTLYNFCQQTNCADGSIPNGSPTLRNGQLYGATEQGGLYNSGLIYRIAE
ncbi:MAG: choice-of-anchor tandem repeat GloVer-containing protein, partial [Terriglobales bacterium]